MVPYIIITPNLTLQYISVYINIHVWEYIHIYEYISLIWWIYYMLIKQIPSLICTSKMGGMSLLHCLVREAFAIKIPVGWLLRPAVGLQDT